MVPNIILQNASTEFLDLHYVYVSEALEVSCRVNYVDAIFNSQNSSNRYWISFWTGMFNEEWKILPLALKWWR